MYMYRVMPGLLIFIMALIMALFFTVFIGAAIFSAPGSVCRPFRL